MSEPVWLPIELVVAFHAEQLRLFGGLEGLRDPGLLASAVERARNKWAYEAADLPELAASYAFGVARNHPFVDGNKRAALLSTITFLGLNGVDFLVDEAEFAAAILALAAGEIDEAGLTRWIRDNWPSKV